MVVHETDDNLQLEPASQPERCRVRAGVRAGIGAGSMLALLLVLSVMPGAAAFAAPEAVGHISIILHEVVRPKPDRDPREPRVVVSQIAVDRSVPVPRAVEWHGSGMQRGMFPLVHRERSHRSLAEVFAANPWCMSTPPPMA